MASLGALIIEMVVGTGRFETDLGRAAKAAEKRANEIRGHFIKIGAGIASSLAAAFGARAIGRAVSDSIRLGDELAKAAQKSGIAVREFSELAYAAQLSDVEITGLSAALKKMQVSLSEGGTGSKGVLQTLTALGLRLDDLKSRRPDQQFEVIGDAINGLKDPADRTRAAVELFGRAGADLLPLFEQGADGIRLLRAEAEDLGKTLDEEGAKRLQAADDATKRLKASTEGLSQTLAIKLSPAIAGAADELRQFLGGQTTRERLEELKRLRENLSKPIALNPGLPAHAGERQLLANIEAQILEAQRRLRLLAPPVTHNRGARLIEPATAPGFENETFTKLQAQLRERIALYGKVGEAAKIAFDIESGAITGLNDAQKKELIAYAKQYDAKVKAAEVSEQLSQRQKSSQEGIELLVESLEREVATFGKGEVAILQYDLAHGALAKRFKEAGPAVKGMSADILDFTKRLEENKKAAEEVEKTFRQFDELKEKAAAVFEATRTPLERYNDEIVRLIRLRETLQNGKPLLDDETFKRGIEAAQDALKKATSDGDKFSEQFKDGIFRSLGDGIYTAMTDGAKRGWRGFLDAGLETINRLVAQALAKRIAEGLFGNEKDGGGGWLASAGKIFSGMFGGARALGGPVSAGKLYRINEREPELFRPNTGGQVIPLSKMGSAGGNVTQNIMVQGRADLRTARQMQIEAARQQRIATARLG